MCWIKLMTNGMYLVLHTLLLLHLQHLISYCLGWWSYMQLAMFSQLAVRPLMVHLGLWDVFHCPEEKPSLWKTQICVHAYACKAMGALRWSLLTPLGTRTPSLCLFMQYLCVKWWTPWSGHLCVLYTGTSPLRVKICVCVNDRCSKVAIYANLCVTS